MTAPVCDMCGEPGELRVFSFDGWIPDEHWCRECYGGPHEEHEWTDFPLVQPPLSPAAAYLTEAAKRRNGV